MTGGRALGLALAGSLAAGVSAAPATAADEPAGGAIYTEHCGICHGADLSGEAHWSRSAPTGAVPAPPLGKGSHAARYSREQLTTIIRWGVDELGMQRYEPTMPEFDAVLTEDEIAALVGFLIRRRADP
ncbi:MAG: cytochrome c [Rhodospirillaceae bacterium]|jgi:mono/diheme cytochrome c family protein|nr:cytochrome c [Rhodospirillaceae bacterium]MBT6119312.1 cytochrome c [Rhodospirillaceae bacterium]